VAIRSTGQAGAGAGLQAIYTSPSTFIWSIAADKDGRGVRATGAPARVYRITPDGKSATIFEPQGIAGGNPFALGQDGAIYAATSPMARCIASRASERWRQLRLSSPRRRSDPKTKYIWDMAFDAQGRLYIALATTVKFTAWTRADRARSSLSQMKRTCAHWRLIPKAM